MKAVQGESGGVGLDAIVDEGHSHSYSISSPSFLSSLLCWPLLLPFLLLNFRFNFVFICSLISLLSLPFSPSAPSSFSPLPMSAYLLLPFLFPLLSRFLSVSRLSGNPSTRYISFTRPSWHLCLLPTHSGPPLPLLLLPPYFFPLPFKFLSPLLFSFSFFSFSPYGFLSPVGSS